MFPQGDGQEVEQLEPTRDAGAAGRGLGLSATDPVPITILLTITTMHPCSRNLNSLICSIFFALHL